MATPERRKLLTRPRPSWAWQDDAACHGEDLVLFFGPDKERQPERDVRERKAKAICAQCPVRAACLDYALSRPEKTGLWGGLNEDERSSERRRRARNAAYDTNPNPVTVSEKLCRICEQVKDADDFQRDRRSSDGLNASCRDCTNEAARRRREAQKAVA